jgi:hypothetical protein
MTIAGTIRFQNVSKPAHRVTVFVRVEEIGQAEGPASRIAEVILRNVDISAEASPLPFTIANVTVVPGGRQVVRVHADVDGDGRVSRGDYVSMQSYPVTADTSGRMEIVVREVR